MRSGQQDGDGGGGKDGGSGPTDGREGTGGGEEKGEETATVPTQPGERGAGRTAGRSGAAARDRKDGSVVTPGVVNVPITHPTYFSKTSVYFPFQI